jgi:transcriptional regulator with XRE-family HTH domain
MLTTGYQLAAARALIGMDQATLAERAKLHINTVRMMEATKGEPLRARFHNVQAVQRVLEAAGVEFTNGNAPGVKMRAR